MLGSVAVLDAVVVDAPPLSTELTRPYIDDWPLPEAEVKDAGVEDAYSDPPPPEYSNAVTRLEVGVGEVETVMVSPICRAVCIRDTQIPTWNPSREYAWVASLYLLFRLSVMDDGGR